MRRPRLKPTRQLLTERVLITEKQTISTWESAASVIWEAPVVKVIRRRRRR